MNIKNIVENLLNNMLPNREAPQLAVVDKVYIEAGKGTYSCDVTMLRTGDLKKTNKKYKKVPISTIWATKNKAGIYAPIQKDMIVIVNFLEWNKAFPYIDGIYSKQYDTVEHNNNEFIITDGSDLYIKLTTGENKKIELIDTFNNNKIELTQNGVKITAGNTTLTLTDLIELKNTHTTLKECFLDLWTELDTLNDNCSNIQTTGSPYSHTVIPAPFIAQKVNIQSKKTKIDTIFK